MKRIVGLLVLVWFLSLMYPGIAGAWISGSKLLEGMKESENMEQRKPAVDFTAGWYIGFVSGVTETGNIYQSFCLGENVSVAQSVAVVEKYLKEFPEKWNQPAHILVIDALKKAFPCGR